MMDFTGMKASEVKEAAKTKVYDICKEALINEFGEEAFTQTASKKFVVAVGADDNGTEVCVEIPVTCKEIESKQTAKKTFVPFDRAAAGMEFQEKEAKKSK